LHVAKIGENSLLPQIQFIVSPSLQTFADKQSDGTTSRIPKLKTFRSNNTTSITSSDRSSKDTTKSTSIDLPETQVLFPKFCQDLKNAFKSFRAEYPRAYFGRLNLKRQVFPVCWTKFHESEEVPLYGLATIVEDEPRLELLKNRNDYFSGVSIGHIDDYPLDGTFLYYGDDGMVYHFPCEGLKSGPQGIRHVCAFRRLDEIMAEFA
jgi:hypothetical protein